MQVIARDLGSSQFCKNKTNLESYTTVPCLQAGIQFVNSVGNSVGSFEGRGKMIRKRSKSLETKRMVLHRNLPSGHDQLGGGYAAVADVLADYIETETRGGSIGLEGEWGTGKSNILFFLKKELEQRCKKKVAFHTFNAWEHEGDDLRRSFLEELNTNLNNGDTAVANAIWEDREHVAEHTTRSIRPLAILLAILIALIPVYSAALGYLDPKYVDSVKQISLLREGLEAVGVAQVGTVVRWLFGLTLVPLVLILLCASYACIQGLFGIPWPKGAFEQGAPKWKRMGQALIHMFSIVDTSATGTTKTDISRSPASSFDTFRRHLRSILQSARAKKTKIVIAVDNIDRLAPASAQKFWASLAPFFEKAAVEEAGHLPDGLFLVMPYAKSQLELIYGQSNDLRVVREGPEGGYLKAPELREFADRADGYIEKSFDIVLEVPKPIFGDWNKYLEERLCQSFPELVKAIDDRERICHLYNYSGAWSTSPRQMNTFVNQLVLLRAQRNRIDDTPIHLTTLAAYILEKLGQLPVVGIHRLDSVKEASIVDQDYPTLFAAIYYGVPRESAAQAVLQQPIRDALYSSGNSERSTLVDLIEVPSFGKIFEQEVAGLAPLQRAGADMIIHIAWHLEHGLSEAVADRVWGHLARSLVAAEKWPEYITILAKYVRLIAMHLNHESCRNFQAGVANKLSSLSNEFKSRNDLEKWVTENEYANVKSWLDISEALSVPDVDLIMIEEPRATLFLLAEWAQRNQPSSYCPMRSHIPLRVLLEEQYIEALYFFDFIAAIRALKPSSAEFLESVNIENILRQLVSESNTTKKKLIYNLGSLLLAVLIGQSQEARSGIADIYRSGWAFKIVNGASGIEVEQYTAMFMVAWVICPPESRQPNTTIPVAIQRALGNPKVDLGTFPTIRTFLQTQHLLQYVADASVRTSPVQLLAFQLFEAIVTEVETDPKQDQALEKIVVDAEVFISDPGLVAKLESWNSQALKLLFSVMEDGAQFFKQLIHQPFSAATAYNARRLVEHSAGYQDSSYSDYLKRSLDGLSQEVWREQMSVDIEAKESLIALARLLADRFGGLILKQPVRDAIREIAKEYANGNGNLGHFRAQTIQTAIGLLSESEKSLLQREVLELLLTPGESYCLVPLVQVFGVEKFKATNAYKYANEFCEGLEKILRDGKVDGARACLQMAQKFGRLYTHRSLKASIKEPLADRIWNYIGQERQTMSAICEDLANVLNIPKP